MTRPQLEHIIRAAAANADVRDIVVIGSQSVLGSTPNPPIELTVSMEADVFPLDASDRSILIDGAIGELSLFHETFGYYAHGVDEMTAVLPDGWRDRLVRVETAGTMGAVGWCLEPNDLAVSKLAAGREKDFAFVDVMIAVEIATLRIINARIKQTGRLDDASRTRLLARLKG